MIANLKNLIGIHKIFGHNRELMLYPAHERVMS